MSTVSQHEHVQQETAAARAAFCPDALEIRKDFEKLGDWQRHFRKHPWLYCGGAATLGFFLAPRRQASRSADASLSAQSTLNCGVVPRTFEVLAKTFLEIAVSTLAEAVIAVLVQHGKESTASLSTNQVQRASAGKGEHPRESVAPPQDAQMATDCQKATALDMERRPIWTAVERFMRLKVVDCPKRSIALALSAGVALGWFVKRQ
jgi:hypothetical protein